MKIKDNYMLSEIEGEYIIITIGNIEDGFNGYLKINETGKYIWEQLENEISEEELIKNFSNQYSLDIDKAREDVNSFLSVLKKVDAIE